MAWGSIEKDNDIHCKRSSRIHGQKKVLMPDGTPIWQVTPLSNDDCDLGRAIGFGSHEKEDITIQYKELDLWN